MFYLYYFPQKTGDNFYEMSKPTFWKKKIIKRKRNTQEKYFKMSYAEIFTQHAKSQIAEFTLVLARDNACYSLILKP